MSGIISDSAHDLEIGMTKAMASCNVVVTSGGVSGMESCHLVPCCALPALTHLQLRVSCIVLITRSADGYSIA